MSDVREFDKVREELTSVSGEIKSLLEKQDAEIKSIGGTSTETKEALRKHTERFDQLEADKKGLLDRIEAMEVAAKRPMYEGKSSTLATPGYQFATSTEYKNARANGSSNTSPVSVGSLFERKDIDPTVGDDQPDSPVRPDRVPEIFFDPGQRQLRLMDVMNVAPTNSNTIEFVVEKDFDPSNAGAQDGEGAAKQQGAMSWELKSAPVATIAHWIKASRQVLDDAAMVQGHIDGRLAYSVMQELEDQLIFGDGTGGKLTGIYNTPGVQTIGAPAVNDTALDHIRKAIRDVRLSEYAATGVIINPSDWADIELLKDEDERYIWVTPPAGGEMRLWRVPVIESTVMGEGQFLTGAFGLGAQVWDRQRATIRISDSHDTDFTSNLVTILAELRMALTVYRPKSFIKGTLNAEAAT